MGSDGSCLRKPYSAAPRSWRACDPPLPRPNCDRHCPPCSPGSESIASIFAPWSKWHRQPEASAANSAPSRESFTMRAHCIRRTHSASRRTVLKRPCRYTRSPRPCSPGFCKPVATDRLVRYSSPHGCTAPPAGMTFPSRNIRPDIGPDAPIAPPNWFNSPTLRSGNGTTARSGTMPTQSVLVSSRSRHQPPRRRLRVRCSPSFRTPQWRPILRAPLGRYVTSSNGH